MEAIEPGGEVRINDRTVVRLIAVLDPAAEHFLARRHNRQFPNKLHGLPGHADPLFLAETGPVSYNDAKRHLRGPACGPGRFARPDRVGEAGPILSHGHRVPRGVTDASSQAAADRPDSE